MPSLPWILRAPGVPYFITDAAVPWTPIGQNDAISWVELRGLHRRHDMCAVRRHLRMLSESGVTCLRLMLEYAETGEHYLEQPVGEFDPVLVQLWDDLFLLCEQAGLRILLTPYDTFFTWTKWAQHPYNAAQGGPCVERTRLLICPKTRRAIKARLAFATERWGASGALFAWDLWNEMHPAQGDNVPTCFADFIDDVGPFLRDLEIRLHGRAHLQCVSVFGPELGWKPWLNEPIFRHPGLDFASSHFYEEGTIDDPHDTVAPAISVGRLVREALDEITDQRPFLDSEHGPIHSFKDHAIVLSEPFDDEYFRHIQWAHVASGGAGGGMRWPNRNPHILTPGMRRAQRGLAAFLPLIDWPHFDRRGLGAHLIATDQDVACFGCGDAAQALVWLLCTCTQSSGHVDTSPRPSFEVWVPGLAPGAYRAVLWDTASGQEIGRVAAVPGPGGAQAVAVAALQGDIAIAVRREG